MGGRSGGGGGGSIRKAMCQKLFFPAAVKLFFGHILANFGHIQLLPKVTG